MVTKKEPMIESDRMTHKEEEEKEKQTNLDQSATISPGFPSKFSLDIQSSLSTWKSVEPINDDLRKFRNYQI